MEPFDVDPEWFEPIVIKKVGKSKSGRDRYAVAGIEDEPMNRREMVILLTALEIPTHEIAFMDLEFKENPEFTEAHFGVMRNLLFCR